MSGPAADQTAALNRIADALFTQAKAMSRQVKVAEAQLELTQTMLIIQQQNLATSKALEQSLTSGRSRVHADAQG